MAVCISDMGSKTAYRRSNRLRGRIGRGGLFARVLIILALTCQQSVWAQQDRRPGARLPELPEYTPAATSKGILPPLSLPNKSDTQSLQAGRRVFVRDYRLSGNTALADEELERLLAPYSNRDVGFTELAELRDTLTRAYIDRGYMTSGAVIPSQTMRDDVLEIHLVEGVLADVNVETNGRLQESYIRKRIQRGGVAPVNVKSIEERLQILLHQDERIARIEANLKPGPQRAQSVLDLAVTEASPYRTYFELSNYESPSVGSLRGLARFTHINVTGAGDRFAATLRKSEGLDGVEASYALPLNAHDTVLAVHGQYTESDVVEKPFDILNIESRSETYGLTLGQPVFRSANSRFELSLTTEYRRSKSFVSGTPYSSDDVEKGVSEVAVIRFAQHWTLRKRRHAISARSAVSVGVDALGATKNTGDAADGQFVSWLGQVQYAQRIAWLDAQLIGRVAVQLSDSPLLGLEQFSLGGHTSVRGYRENALVLDNGAAASLEARVPILVRSAGLPRLEVGPFVDAGRAWAHNDSPDEGDKTLLSAGIRASWAITNSAVLEGTWAEALRDMPGGGEHTLQDSGVQLRLSATF